MKFVLILLALSASNMAAVKLCTFGKEAILDIYSRFDTFRKAKKIDTERDFPRMQNFQHYENGKDGGMASITHKNDVLTEYYNFNNQNEIVTMNGTFEIKDGPIIKYERNSEGIFSFEDSKNGKKFKLNVLNLKDIPPDDFVEDIQQSYRKIMFKLIYLREIMFDNRDFFLKDFEHISLLTYDPFSGGYYVQFVDNMDDNRLSIFVRYDNDVTLSEPIINHQKIHGVFKCGKKSQKYDVLYGKVVVNEKPYEDGFV